MPFMSLHATKTSLSLLALSGATTLFLLAQNASFHNAPASSQQTKNPYAGQTAKVASGKQIYEKSCSSCHGGNGQGTGNVPPLATGAAQSATDGEIFWYITKGDLNNGMPSWASMPADQRWAVVTYIKSLKNSSATSQAAPSATASTNAPAKSTALPPKAPFTDYRYESPGTTRWIRLKDLPSPMPDESATNGPKVVPRPQNMWPKAPKGFTVSLYASGLNNPRLMRPAPNGDIFLAETAAGNIKVFRGMTAGGKPKEVHVFATGLNTPFGIAFYPLGRILNGFTSLIWTRSFGSRITMVMSLLRDRHNISMIFLLADIIVRVMSNSLPMARRCMSLSDRRRISMMLTTQLRVRKIAPIFLSTTPMDLACGSSRLEFAILLALR